MTEIQIAAFLEYKGIDPRSRAWRRMWCAAARLAEALRRHALLDVTENDLKELSSADALTIEELYAAAYREAGA